MALLESSTQSRVDLKTSARVEWKWIALICLLLGISGGVRLLRDWRFYALSMEQERSPFPLAEIPERLGTWRAIEGSDRKLEPEIAYVAGATDHVERIYRNEKTGEIANVLILYGLALKVWAHTPGICYPSQDFRPVTPSRDQDVLVSVADSASQARFLEQHFSKSIAGRVDYRVVYHSFRHAGRWDYDMGKYWKLFRYYPGMFKVQVQQQAEIGVKGDESSVQELLGQLVEEIDHRLPRPK